MDTKANGPGSQVRKDIVNRHVFFTPEGNGWQSKPEFPTAQEILAKVEEIQLPMNPVDEPWASKDEYLQAQYEILRHEAVEGLRESVRASRKRKAMADDDDTCIYTQVRVKEYLMSTFGPITRVSFSTERSDFKIVWQQSKRLQPGGIVALSTKDDNFRTICKVASIAQRPYRDGLDQDPPLVDLLWADPKDAVLDPNLEMVMVESRKGYFESARHSLIGLQHAARTDSPLDKYLTGAQTKDKPPAFLRENPLMDLSLLTHKATDNDCDTVVEMSSHNVVNGDISNFKDLTYLDESQLHGLHRIVSKELAIVQGPPGTGKTYTSVEALKTMVTNRRRSRRPPIIVAAQTNHALDQILEHCLKAGVVILRMGGRTQSEAIQPRTLYQLRQSAQLPADRQCGSVDRQRHANTKQIESLIEGLFGDKLLDPDALVKAGIINEKQRDSLTDDSMESNYEGEVQGPFALWLGENLIPAKIARDRHKTQNEVREAEAREKLPEFECEDDELENIADEEEDQFRFRGSVIKLEHVWTGKAPTHLSSSTRAVETALRKHKGDLFGIAPELRGAVYQYFQAKLLEDMTPKFAALLVENIKLCKERKVLKFLGNTQLVQKEQIDIVGCTTTGLTKYRGCLAAMLPQSILIEEAAETREANIVSALYPSVQQLILVGDHKQLAPKCDIHYLGDAPYNINVSLFQRLVNLDMQFVMLKEQRRMKPELRHLLKRFYPDLVDHPIVKSINQRPDVPGMGGRNCWLFDHKWSEDTDENFSRFNRDEAEMITNFFSYLVCNGTPAARITVLTFYKGQRKRLLQRMKRHPSLMGSEFNVCTVDSYQGEENDIILLSLVRSPQPGRPYSVGFLTDERRAVVAISRARRGFYIFGNVDNILEASQESHTLWVKIWNGFVELERVCRAQGLPIVCQPHNREVWMKEVDDWADNAGGCDLDCKQTRPCGHPCTLKCHALKHEQLPCGEPCRKTLLCDHGCQRLCSQACFCDCKMFTDATRQAQVAARQQMSLEQRMIQMGGEPSEMLKASMNQRSNNNNSMLQAQIASPPRPAPAPQGIVAHEWGQFVQNVEQHDERLGLERRSPEKQQAPGTIIKEVYQSTALVKGRRVGDGGRAVQQVQLAAASQGSSASTSVQVQQAGTNASVTKASVTNVQSKLAGLMMSVESSPPREHDSVSVQQTSVYQTASDETSLLDGPCLVDTGVPDLGSPNHQTTQITFIQPLIPSSGTSEAIATEPAHSDTGTTKSAQPQEQAEDDWLIEL